MSKHTDDAAPSGGNASNATDPNMTQTTDNPNSAYERLLTDDRVTREKFARVYYEKGATTTAIANYLDVDNGTISRLMQAFGIAPGNGPDEDAENWIISHLPYEWAVDLCDERDIEPAPPEECYDSTVPRNEIPTNTEARDGKTAPDVPDAYRMVTSAVGSKIRDAGADPEDIYNAAMDYSPPRQLPDSLYVANRPSYDRLIGRFACESEFIGLFVALYEQAPSVWLSADDVTTALPDAGERSVRAASSMAGRARVFEHKPIKPREYRLTDEGYRVMTGERLWDSEPLALADTPDSPAPSGKLPRGDDYPDAGELAELYWVEHRPPDEIAEKFNVSPATVRGWLQDADIQLGRDRYPSDERIAELRDRFDTLDLSTEMTEQDIRDLYAEIRDRMASAELAGAAAKSARNANANGETQPATNGGGDDGGSGSGGPADASADETTDDDEQLIHDHGLDITRPISATPHGVLSDEWLAVRYYHDRLNYGQIAELAGGGVNYTAVMHAMHDAGINPGRDAIREEAVTKRIADMRTKPNVTTRDVAERMRKLRGDAFDAEHGDDDSKDTPTASDSAGIDAEPTESESESEQNTNTMSETEKPTSNPSADDQLPHYDEYTEYVPKKGQVPDGEDYVVLPENAKKSDVEFAAHYWARVNNVKPWGVFVSLNGRNAARDTVSGLVHKSKMLHKPTDFDIGDELVVELSGRKDNGDINFRLVTEIDGHPGGTGEWTFNRAKLVEEAGTYDHNFETTDKDDVKTQTLGDSATVTNTDAADDAADADADADTDTGTDTDTEGETMTDAPDHLTGKWTVFDRESIARLYYYYGLSQPVIGRLYDTGQSNVSKAMDAFDLNPGRTKESKHEQFEQVSDEYAWDTDERGDGLPEGAANDSTNAVLIETLTADDHVPTPDVPAPVPEPEPEEPEPEEPDPEPDAEEPPAADEPDGERARTAAADESESLEGATTPADEEPALPSRALADGEVAIDRAALRRALRDAQQHLDIAPDGSELYFVSKGREMAIRDIIADSGLDANDFHDK